VQNDVKHTSTSETVSEIRKTAICLWSHVDVMLMLKLMLMIAFRACSLRRLSPWWPSRVSVSYEFVWETWWLRDWEERCFLVWNILSRKLLIEKVAGIFIWSLSLAGPPLPAIQAGLWSAPHLQIPLLPKRQFLILTRIGNRGAMRRLWEQRNQHTSDTASRNRNC